MSVSGDSHRSIRLSTLGIRLLLLLLLVLIASVSVAQQPGGEGVGDRLYPKLGNGGYDVQHYDIDLNFMPATYRISATTTLDAVASQDLSSFSLDLFGLTVESVSVNGTDVLFEHVGHKLTITPAAFLDAGEAFVVSIDYAGRPQPVYDPGVYWQPLGWHYVTGDYYITDGEPTGSMNWFPCNNHPSDKATFTTGITVPAGLSAIANGLLTDKVENDDGTEKFVWTMDDPMSSHNAFVAVGDFVAVRDDSGPASIINYFPPDSAEALAATFAETQDMMAWLVDRLGPYPFATYGVVGLPATDSTTDSQSISIFSPTYATPEYILHQLAHQWFGNSVTPARWEDMWIKEGFASYMEFIYPYGSWQESSRDEILSYIYGVEAPVGIEIDELYGISVFWRGALTLDALRAEIGDELFFDLLRTFHQQYVHSVATTDDFIAVAESVSGRDLSQLFDAWLFSDEMPVER